MTYSKRVTLFYLSAILNKIETLFIVLYLHNVFYLSAILNKIETIF